MYQINLDVVVVGAGVEGTATAYQLARRGRRVLLLEQFSLPHSRGSSHGTTRITRRVYPEAEFYGPIMEEAYREWDQLERTSGEKLFCQNGVLMLGNPKQVAQVASSMGKQGLSYECLTNSEITSRYPGSFSQIDDMVGLVDPSGGTLKADKALAAMWQVIKAHASCSVKDEEVVLDIKAGRPVTVVTDKGRYVANSVVICAGPWASPFLERLGVKLDLRVVLVKVLFWKSKEPENQFNHESPALLFYYGGKDKDRSTGSYGVPPPEKAGYYKFCTHTGPLTNPDDRDGAVSTDQHLKTVAQVEAIVTKYLPGLEPKPAVVESCMYTVSPDHHPILDSVPQHPNIVYGCGFSGHGFKLGPVVGNILADLATGRTPKFDMAPFRATRFSRPGSKL